MQKGDAQTYRPADETCSMDRKSSYKAIVMALLYVLLWIRFCNLSNAEGALTTMIPVGRKTHGPFVNWSGPEKSPTYKLAVALLRI
jgi:hypothetical protein